MILSWTGLFHGVAWSGQEDARSADLDVSRVAVARAPTPKMIQSQRHYTRESKWKSNSSLF